MFNNFNDKNCAFEPLKRMYQLNLELLEQLNVTCGWLLKNKINVPNKQSLVSLLIKSRTLLEEIYTSDEFLQTKRTDEDFTEPKSITFLYLK